MSAIPFNPLLKVNKEDVETLREFFGIEDQKRIDDSLTTVKEWLQKQDHLVEASKYMSPAYWERMYVLAKASTENMKKKIDKIFTARALMPEICLNKTPGEFKNLFDSVKYVPLPNLSPKDRTRVVVTKLVAKNIDEFSLLPYFRYANMIGEYRLHYDYSNGDRYILDMSKETIISKMNPMLMRKSDAISEAYGIRIKGIHILNAPAFVDTFVRMLKQTMKEKVAGRFHVHNSYEELHEHIPKEILPEDFGGEEMSIDKLCDLWKEHLNTEEATRLIKESDKIISDETKRSSSDFNEEHMGMPGSFRKLTVD